MNCTSRWPGSIAVVTALLGTTAVAQQKPVRIDLVTTIAPNHVPITAAAFSPDGTLLASGSQNGDLQVTRLATRKVLWTLTPSMGSVSAVTFSPDGSRLACRGQSLTMHDPLTGDERLRVESVGPTCFVWHPDGKRFAYDIGRSLYVDDGGSMTMVARLRQSISALALGSGDELFAGDDRGRVWRVTPSGGTPTLHRDHRQSGNDTARSLHLVFIDGALFDVPSKGPVRRGDVEFATDEATFAFACSPDGRAFAAGGETRVRWWIDGGASFTDVPQSAPVTALAFHPVGERLFVANQGGEQAVIRSGHENVALEGRPSRVRAMALTADGTTVAVLGTCWGLHPLDGRPPRFLPDAYDVRAGRSGGELIVRYSTRAAVFDTRRNQEVRSFDAMPDRVPTSLGDPAETLTARAARVDETGAMKPLLARSTPFHDGAIAFAIDGRWAFGGPPRDGLIGSMLVVADAAGAPLRTVDDEHGVRSLVFSPDGRQLYCLLQPDLDLHSFVRLNGVGLRIRDAATLKVEREAEVHLEQWQFLDADRALVRSEKELQVWDVAGLTLLQRLGIEGEFALSDDRRTLVVKRRDAVDVYRLTLD